MQYGAMKHNPTAFDTALLSKLTNAHNIYVAE